MKILLQNGNLEETVQTRTGGVSAMLPTRIPHPSRGYFVTSNALFVTFGTAFGEQLASADDLFPGDVLTLKQGNSAVSVSFDNLSAGVKKLHFLNVNIGQSMMLAHTSRSLTLMSEFGQVINACVLETSENEAKPFSILFNSCPEQSIEYTLIDVANQ